MDVDLLIHYSDDRLCEIVAIRPVDGTPAYRIATRREELGSCINQAMQEARRIFAADPWPVRSIAH